MIWLVLVLSIILRIINIDQSLWLDEATQTVLSSKSIYSIIFDRVGDFHPPLSYIVFHLWLLLGDSEIWLRSLSVIFGVATVYLVFKIADRLFNKKVALFSALLLAVAPYHVYYSQEVRMYSMTTFLASLSMYYFIVQKRFGYIVSTVALVLTHYMGFFLLLSQLIFVLYYEKKRIKGFIFSLLSISFGYLFWLPFFGQQLLNGIKADQYLPGWGNLLSENLFKAVPLLLLKFSIGRISFDNDLIYIPLIVFVISFFCFILYRSIKQDKNTRLVLFWFLLPIFLTWFISFFIPMFQPFRLLFIIPAFYILISVGIFELKRYKNIVIVTLLLITVSSLVIYYSDQKFWREDWKGAINFLDQTDKDKDDIVVAWPEAFDPIKWYGKDLTVIGVVSVFPSQKDLVYKNMDKISLN